MMEENCKKYGNILVVDDNPMNIRLLVEMLKNEGYSVWPAPNGVRALAVLEKHAIDLILLDVRMPEMDGYEVCEGIKSNKKTQDIPVIFISALNQTFDKLKAFKAGGVDYITKPFEEEEVLARVKLQLTLVEQQKRLQVLTESSFEGIMIHMDGKIVEVNQNFADMLGYKRDELTGINAFDLLTPASQNTALHHMQTNFDRPYEVQAIKKDGTIFTVDAKGRSVTWQGYAARAVIIRDMSWRTFFRQEQRAIDIALLDSSQFGELVGKSDMMKKVFESILRAAVSDAPVLISGETGTGKELTARTIFNMTEQYDRNFVPVNCASIPEHLFESLFFGHKKGAFTGAEKEHIGYFAQAEGGILFLDEVGELSLEMQAKLLRVLDDFTYTPVGARSPKKADVRLIAATNRDLRTLVDRKKVRSDFFHRLYVLGIDLPPLRWRKDDLPVLIAHFLQKNTRPDSPLPAIPPKILDRFYDYDWPGNVRELFNELQRLLATGEVDLSGRLPEEAAGNKSGHAAQDNIPLDKAIEQFEQYYIPRTLRLHDGHKGKTAEILQVDRKTLYRKLKKFDLT
jgi:PAS domain S-box-containing protein